MLADVVSGVCDLAGQVVNRDIKPENILLLDGKWCLADFGISRYTEATTDEDTRKRAFTPAYCAPERWRSERAVSASDVYSVGILMYELLTGGRPFVGPSAEDYREQHLHMNPPEIESVPTAIATLCDECLYKAPGARPTAATALARLERSSATATISQARSRLAGANQLEVQRRAEQALRVSQELSDVERRRSLYEAAVASFSDVVRELLDVIAEEAPAARIVRSRDKFAARVELSGAVLAVSTITHTDPDPWNYDPPAFDVIAHSSIELSIPRTRHGYEGRSHSIWYCDAAQAGVYTWYETSFMISLPSLRDRKSTRLNSSHIPLSRMPSSA